MANLTPIKPQLTTAEYVALALSSPKDTVLEVYSDGTFSVSGGRGGSIRLSPWERKEPQFQEGFNARWAERFGDQPVPEGTSARTR